MEDMVFLGAAIGTSGCGFRPHYTAPLREDDLQGQLTLFSAFERRGYEGLILWPIHPQAFRKPVERAVNKGMPVVVIGSELGIESNNLSYILNDEEAGVRLAADRLSEVMGGRGWAVINGVDVNSAITLERLSILQRYVADRYPNIHLREPVLAGNQVAEQEQLTQRILREYPNVDAFVALSAASTRGTYYAIIKEAPHHHVALIGFDQELLPTDGDLLIDGVVAQRAREMGQVAAEAICQKLAGQPMPKHIVLEPFMITPSNFNSREVENELSGKWLTIPGRTP